jgi:hypothetical protein
MDIIIGIIPMHLRNMILEKSQLRTARTMILHSTEEILDPGEIV